jgi:hypothetical protein
VSARYPDFSVASFLSWLRRGQGRGGYATDGERGAELETYATSASAGASLILDALGQLFPRTMGTLLAEIEAEEGLAETAVRTTEERKKRIEAMRRILATPAKATIDDLINAIGGFSSVSTLPATTRAMQLAAGTGIGGAPEGIFWQTLKRSFTANDPDESARVVTLIEALHRWQPARRVTRRGISDTRRLLTIDDAALWDSGGFTFTGDASLSRQTGAVRAMNRPPARVVPFYPGMRIDHDHLAEVQDAILWKKHITSTAQVGDAGGLWAFAAFSIANGVTITIDSRDWRSRWVTSSLRNFTSLGASYLPGGANDYAPGGRNLAFGWAGAAGNLWDIAAFPAPTGVNLSVGASGQLQLTNATGASLTGTLFVWGPGKVKNGTGLSRIINPVKGTALDNATDGLTTANVAKLWDAAIIRRSTAGAAWASYAGDGGLRRVLVVSNFESGQGARDIVLDASADWRDRLILTRSIAAGESLSSPEVAGTFPGGGNDDALKGDGNSAYPIVHHWYSGPGSTAQQSAPYYGTELFGGGVNTRIYARASDGALMLGAASGADSRTFGIMLDATEQTGMRSTPATVAQVAPTPGSEIEPWVLNAIQDVGCVDQVTGARGLAADNSSTHLRDVVKSEAFPLGIIAHGKPRIPEEWLVRDRFGEARSIERARMFQRRQSMARGHIRKSFDVSIPGLLSVPLDSSIDWRDRLVFVTAWLSSSDIRPGGANETGPNVGLGTFYYGAAYTGGDPETPLIIGYPIRLTPQSAGTPFITITPNAIGSLVISYSAGGPVYVVGMIEASDVLGPRTFRDLPY